MPTRRGIGVAAASVLALVGAWRLRYPELAVPGLAGLMTLALAAGWLFGAGALSAEREVAPPKAERGSPALGRVQVANAGPRRSRAARAVDRVGERDVQVDLPALAPGVARTVVYAIPTSRRGRVQVGPLRVLLGDPLGLFERRRRCGTDRSLLVRPRVLAIDPPAAGRTASLDGPDSETSPSGTVTFHSLRGYVFGDDLRHIHWRTTARLGTLMVRRLVDAGEPRVELVLDPRPEVYQDPEAFELAVDVAASVAVAAARLGFPVAVRTSSGRMLAVRGVRGTEGLLDWLALVEADPGADMGGAVRRAAQGGQADARGALVVVSGDAGADLVETVAAVAPRFDHATVVRVGAGFGPAPDAARVRVLDAATDEAFVAGWRSGVRA